MQEWTQPTPSDGVDAVSYQIPSSVREVVRDYRNIGQFGLASLIQEVAETAYLKGQLDSINETLKGSQIL